MTPWLVGAVFGLGAFCIGEGIWIMGQNRRLITYAEQLLAVGADNVAQTPSKSAAPTPQPEPHTEPIAVVKAEPVDEWRTRFQFKTSSAPRSDT